MTTLRVFIGYDDRQPLAFNVAAHSIWKTASQPVTITRLEIKQLPITRTGLTAFTYSRFLVPWLSNYEGLSIFLDSDILCRADIHELLNFPMEYMGMPVFVVPHAKAFEWPSVMVFRNALCRTLTPAYIDDTRNALFNFSWTEDVGKLPFEWNHLVGYDKPNPDAKLVHFTQGIPCWPETKTCEFADDWIAMAKHTMSTVSFDALMGPSVHIAHMKHLVHDGER